jgi:hypothetical protein
LRDSLINAVRRRAAALRHTAGLNGEVFDALVLMAAGSWTISDLGSGYDEVAALIEEMHSMRRKRLTGIGFSEEQAEELSSLHTRNFM